MPLPEVQRLTNRLHCIVDKAPFMYLGLSVGANMKRQLIWMMVVEKFTKKLNFWKAYTLSTGSRLTLVNSILNSLPLYFFSLFKAPATILTDLEKHHNTFLWGSVGSNKKLIWVSSVKTYGEFATGGLKIASLQATNLALLRKWWWQFRSTPDNHWGKVICALYGEG